MAVPCPPPPSPHIDWGTLLVGFGLGLVASTIGALVTAWATSLASRRDHQFKRMLEATDEARRDIQRAISLAKEYWERDGTHPECHSLESQVMEVQNRIVGALAIVKKLDPKRFREIEEDLQDDFIDALTGGQFQVRGRPADAASIDRVRRFGSRLSEKLLDCSVKPKATTIFSRR